MYLICYYGIMGRKHAPEIDQKIIDLRMSGMPRKDIAEQLGIPLSKVKTVLVKSNISIPMDLRQKNAQAAKTAKNPNWLSDMRSLCQTEEAKAKRRQTSRITYSDPELRELKSAQFKQWWGSLPEEKKQELLEKRKQKFLSSPNVKGYMLRTGEFDPSEELSSSFQKRLESVAFDLGGSVLGQYSSSKQKMLFRCSKGHEFEAIPNTVFLGHWCPNCASTGPSKGQLEVYEYVKTLAPDAILNDSTCLAQGTKRQLELDVYVPSKKLAIEFNGLFWHSNYYSKNNGRHLQKAKACQNAGVNLLAIFEDEWREKKDLVMAMIRQKLGVSTGQKLNARSLQLKRLDKNEDFAWFFNQFHLDGHTQASFAYGLFYLDKLVCCASFRTNFNNELEIARLATDYNYLVRGGAGRLISKIQKPLISFSNNRLSIGDVYQKLGFSLVQENPSSYWYTDGKVRVWRFRCRRVNEPKVLAKYPTEEQQCLAGVQSLFIFGDSRPLYRIEDYGHRKWKIT